MQAGEGTEVSRVQSSQPHRGAATGTGTEHLAPPDSASSEPLQGDPAAFCTSGCAGTSGDQRGVEGKSEVGCKR